MRISVVWGHDSYCTGFGQDLVVGFFAQVFPRLRESGKLLEHLRHHHISRQTSGYFIHGWETTLM
jgi:hypothetical protein